MKGFFSLKETQSTSRPDGKVYSCVSCGLIKGAQSPKMKPFGNFAKGIMNIGAAPSEVDDAAGKPFRGNVGHFLKQTFAEEFGINLWDDCVNLNAVNCRSENKPTSYQIACCRKSVIDYIKEYKPDVIFLHGIEAMESLYGHRWIDALGSIDKWRGWVIPDQELNAWVIPLFDPERVMWDKGKSALPVVWKQDIAAGLEKVGKRIPKYIEPVIDYITDLDVLNDIQADYISFDYETTGLKPHAPGHRIVCVSVADTNDHAFAFMLPKTKKERQPFIDLLLDPTVGKSAQNMKFEHAWSLIRLRTEVQNWFWDTMQASHILDNRPLTTGLKFQSFVRFGITDYSSEISPYLKSPGDNANQINRIDELLKLPDGKQKLLKYCGLDSIYERRLGELQREIMNF